MEVLGGFVCMCLLIALVFMFGGEPDKCAVCDAPIYRTKIGYRRYRCGLDRDNDGGACES